MPSAAFGISLFFRNSYLVPFLEGVASVCEENGVGLSLVSGRSDQAASGIRGALVDGFIFSSLEQADMIEPARRRRLPFVVMDIDGGPEVSSVRVEDRDGGRQVARHLLALGHRRFIVIAPLNRLIPPIFHEAGAAPAGLTAPTAGVPDRLAGFLEVLTEAGIGRDAIQVVEACLTREEEAAFGDAGATLLGRLGGATAVVGLTDGVALSILDKARRRGISCSAGAFGHRLRRCPGGGRRRTAIDDRGAARHREGPGRRAHLARSRAAAARRAAGRAGRPRVDRAAWH